MNNEQKLNAWFAKFEHRFEVGVPHIVADTATEFFKNSFIQKSWDGHPWPKFNPLNKKNRKEPTRGSLMMRTNKLWASIRPATITPQRVVISAGDSEVKYARAHNEGLRISGIHSVKPYTNANFMGRGRPVNIKGHLRKVDFKMPRRQFMGHSAHLNQAIIDRLTAAFNGK